MKKILYNKLWIFFTIWLAPFSYLNGQDVTFDWVKALRGTVTFAESVGNCIKIDSNKNIYVTGYYRGTVDFDPGPNVYSLTSGGMEDIFVCKLDSSGSLIWARNMPGTLYNEATGLDLDSLGNIYLCGSFEGTVDFDPGVGTFNITATSTYNGFICKLNTSGNFLWAFKLSGAQGVRVRSISADRFGRIVCTGTFASTVDFDPGSGTSTMVDAGSLDIFVCRYSSSGSFIWARQLGGTSFDFPKAIVADKDGNVITTGYFSGIADFDPGTSSYNFTCSGSSDAFISKLDSNGSFVWATRTGGTNSDEGNSITCDASGSIYCTGSFADTVDFDPGANEYKLYGFPSTTFILKLDAAGNFIWARHMGGGSSRGTSIMVDTANNVFTSGFFYGRMDFNPGIDSFFLSSNRILSISYYDAFVTKLTSTGTFAWAKTFGGNKSDAAYAVVVDLNGNIFTTGCYRDTVDFDPRDSTFYLMSYGGPEVYIHKMRPCTPTANSISLVRCNSYKSPSNKYTWTNSGTYSDTITNKQKCDSIITIALTIKNKTTSTISITTCNSYKSPSNKYTWTASGIYRDTIPNYVGCDSIISITLIIKSNTGSSSITSCNSYKSPSGRYTWNLTGIYKDTLLNILGCDSVITINLSIDSSTHSYISPSACMIYKSPSNKYTWTKSGIYSDTLKNSKNCDSIITINLTIKNVTYSTIYLSKCGSYKSPSNKYMWTVSGVYKDTITNMVGCDSIITFNLVINNITSSFLNIMTCTTYQSPSKKYNWSTSGIYKDTILNAIGCDSNITINLSVNISSSSVVTVTACDKYIFHSQVYTSSGTYIQTINNAKGCDSIVTLNITIKKSTANSYSLNSCKPITSPSGKFIWNSSGIYKDTIPNKIGCDSILTVNFTLNGINTVVTKSGAKLTAALSGAVYQWHVCFSNNTFTPIPGEIFQSFIASVPGDYAVKISYNSCIDTSSCITTNNIGMNSVIKSNTINIFPNPAGQKITVELLQFKEETNFKISNTIGQTLIEGPLKQTLTEVNLTSLSPGIYFIEIKEGDSVSRIKILKN